MERLGGEGGSAPRRPDWRERLALRLIDCLAESRGEGDPIAHIVQAIADEVGVRFVGLRLQVGEDFPYHAVWGHAPDFAAQHASVFARRRDGTIVRDAAGRPRLACMCGAVVRGEPSCAPGHFTAGGSFLASSLREALGGVDVASVNGLLDACLAAGIESHVLVPLRHGAEVVGILSLGDERPGVLGPEDVAFLERLGAAIGHVLTRRRAEDWLARINACLVALGPDHEANAARITSLSGELLGATCALYDRLEGGRPRTCARWGAPPGDAATVGLEGRLGLEVIRRADREPILLRDLASTPVAGTDPPLVARGPRTCLGAAVLVGGRAVGSLCVLYAEDVAPTELDRRVLGILAAALAGEEARRVAGEALRRQEALYRDLFDNMCEGFALHEIILDAAGAAVDYRFLSVNAAFERLTGLRAAEIVGRTARQVIPGLEPLFVERYGRVALTGEPASFEARVEALDRDFEILAYRPAPGRFACVFSDATERRRAVRLLAASEIKFRTIADHTADLELWLAPDGRIEYLSPACERITGYRREEIEADPDLLMRIVHADDRALVAEHVAQEVGAPETIHNFDFRIRTRGGEERWLNHVCRPVVAPDGAHLGRRVSLRDITVRKGAEEALRASERRFVQMFQQAPIVALLASAETGRLLEVNRRFLEVSGYARAEVIGRTAAEVGLVSEGDRALLDALVQRDRHVERVEVDLRRRDGQAVRCSFASEFVEIDGKPFLLALAEDVTELRRAATDRERLQAELLQAQKLESLGTLAGGIAHDFNNLLGGLLAGLSLLELELGDRSAGREDLAEMKGLIERGAELTRQLLGFARRGKYDARAVDLNEVAGVTGRMFGRSRKDIVLRLELGAARPWILADRTQIEQVLLNLLVNAGQAMPLGGELRVETRDVELAAVDAAVHGVAAGRHVALRVVDTGEGMDEATRRRIFEPFFTTKEPGQGTGLGLASVYGIVKNHGGFVTVESASGQGSTFEVVLPAVDRPGARPPAPVVPPRRGGETILIVDDEEPILDLCARLLRAMGYEVLTAKGGRAAIELLREHRGRVALVILDLVMPGMSGEQTYEALRELVPDVKILLSSGFADEQKAAALLARGCDAFLQKPFDVDALSAKLRQLL